MHKQIVIGVDPSGSFKEGVGTTGIGIIGLDGLLIDHTIVSASDYATQLSYWAGVIHTIEELLIKYPGAVLSVEDYVLYASAAKAQINSEMETSKLIGALTMFAYNYGTHIFMRSASQVKTRWTNSILEYKGIIRKAGASWTDTKGRKINQHSMDAIRHAVHCFYFELEKDKWLT